MKGGGEDVMTKGSSGGGMSRAAKKRAKKNKKKQQTTQQQEEEQPQPQTKRVKPNPNEIIQEDDNRNHKQLSSVAALPKLGDDAASHDESHDEHDEHEDHQDGDGGSVGEEDIIPSFPNTSLLEILLLKESSDEAKAAVLNSLTSKQRAAALFQKILDPTPLDVFYNEYWEKKPLLVRAKDNPNRYDGLLSLQSIKEMSKNHPLYYARDLNVTRYQKDSNGVKRRITLDKLPEDEKDSETGVLVKRSELWSNYDSGCTIRLLCPHKFNDAVHAVLSTLEVELQCMVGANAYLTPPNAAQGFAPHYDDIEAFCLQLEGSKRWKVYNPTLKLPRVSSEDFTVDDLKDMEPVLDVTLERGDLLYMPRGWIHQACTLKDNNEHSLHLTVSAMQQWAWCDLMDIVIPEALENATSSETSSSLRQGLPRGFLEYMGVMHDTSVDENVPDSIKKAGGGDDQELPPFEKRKLQKQEKFKAEAKKRIMKVAMAACDLIDASCDQLGKRFLSDRQPPALTEKELQSTNQGNKKDEEILPNTLCRLVRPGIARLVLEDDKAVVYHCADNARVFQGNPISPLEFEMDDGPALEQLLTTTEPEWIMVNDLMHDTIEDKVGVAGSLYDEGILAIHNPSEEDEGEEFMLKLPNST